MSTSTDGQLCYGIVFPEDYGFPWSTDEFGYENPNECPYDDVPGGYRAGYSSNDPRIDVYWSHQHEWMESNPLPVIVVNYQSGECPVYMLSVQSSLLAASRGYPVEVPAILEVNEQDRQRLLDFCSRHNLEADAPPSWYLSSYWG